MIMGSKTAVRLLTIDSLISKLKVLQMIHRQLFQYTETAQKELLYVKELKNSRSFSRNKSVVIKKT